MINYLYFFLVPSYVCTVKRAQTVTDIAPAVLVVTDLSDSSKEALRWAGHLANNHNTNLRVLFPYRLNQMKVKDDLAQLRKKFETEARTNFNKVAKDVFKEGHPVYDFVAEIGFVNDRIYSNTSENDILMVVMSKKMADTNKETLTELLDQLNTPLLIVPTNGSPKSLNGEFLDAGNMRHVET